jgi:hypothetical protein
LNEIRQKINGCKTGQEIFKKSAWGDNIHGDMDVCEAIKLEK